MELNEIQAVKIQGEGYLVNGSLSVPKADGNRHYEEIKQWLSEGNTPEPEFTEEELKVINDNKSIQEAKQYLVNTDWIIVKINEAQLLGQDIQPLLTKYSVELSEREAKRTIINSLES